MLLDVSPPGRGGHLDRSTSLPFFRPVTHTDVLRASELVAGRLCPLALVLHATATTGSDHRCKACRVATHLPGPVSTAAPQSVCRGPALRVGNALPPALLNVPGAPSIPRGWHR